MTNEEREKAIDALRISIPVRAVTQEEFNDYRKIIHKTIDWLEHDYIFEIKTVTNAEEAEAYPISEK